ncbi:39S ribosomal protein L48, mitochondrial-like isoform X2 [Nycticebus coucang]|uniref:39S ribosomal protein L48, mitochondrial-like isoform X2 n=1 Tax=Nycticebus coucang TaxID=9470 RepID=UPI00234D67A0|nr:39S ribosomal protein L48, mitochondrial-like isoform X2 [Nycticebus coucang]
MSGTLEKVLCLRNNIIFKQVFSSLRFRTSGENSIYSSGGILLSTYWHYKTKPTHGIGRYKHLIKAQEPKKKRTKISGSSATFAEIFLEIIQSNLPEGVRLLVKEHS